jgi:limonene-1,2-epoxide hydrolase
MKRQNIEFMLAWLDALRRRDVDAVAAALAPTVVWQGLREDLVCHGPQEVVEIFVEQRDENYDIDALELIGANAQVVLGVRRPGLREIEGVQLRGEIYNVFTIEDRKITRIDDYVDRHQALAAAGLTAG